MDNLSRVISSLQSENKRLEVELKKVRSAIRVLSRLNGKSSRGVSAPRARHVLSAAARRRIAAAQRARWAKWKAAKKAA
jgi:hypothetical protein